MKTKNKEDPNVTPWNLDRPLTDWVKSASQNNHFQSIRECKEKLIRQFIDIL